MQSTPTPPPSPNDNRNLMIALVLTALVMFGWNMFFDPPASKQEALETMAASGADEAVTPSLDGDATATATPAAPATRRDTLAEDTRVQIQTPYLHGSIRLKGARFDDLTLGKYHQTVDKSSPEVVLLNPRRSGDGYFAEFGWAGNNIDTPGADTVWEASSSVLTTDSPVTLSWTNAQNIRFETEIALNEAYLFTITSRVVNASGEPVTLAPYSLINRTLNEEAQEFFILHQGPLGVANETLEEFGYEDLRDGKRVQELTTGWGGFTDKYWLTALVPAVADDGLNTKATYQHYRSGNDERYQVDMTGAPREIGAGDTLDHQTYFFAGAKELERLDAYSETYGIPLFDRAVDFGALYFLTRPIFELLDWFHSLLGNFGLAILVLTVLVKLVMFPLANKSYASMSQMKLLMPKMQRIREQYGDDRVRMNQEIMQMYKQEGVNPAAGCLPMLIQIPVFFALYKVLFIAIEMRHAPFYGWIEDLSAQDPTNLFTLFGLVPWNAPDFLQIGAWPVIMAATMLIQQRLNPKPADPTQAQVMKFLPFMFLFLFATFPAGLVIYWAWNNTLSIIQQYMITKRFEKIYDKETGRRIKSKKSLKKRST